MLPYLPQFCNGFLTQGPPVWQRAWTAWRPLRLARPARNGRSLQATGRTPRPLSTPLLHAMRTHPPAQHTAACPCGTPRSVSLRRNRARTRRPQPHTRATAVGCRKAAGCPAVIILEHIGHVYLPGRAPCTYWRDPVYLLERAPCTYRGEPRVPTGETPCTYRREPRVPTGETPRVPTGESPVYLLERPYTRNSSNLLFQKGFQAHRL